MHRTSTASRLQPPLRRAPRSRPGIPGHRCFHRAPATRSGRARRRRFGLLDAVLSSADTSTRFHESGVARAGCGSREARTSSIQPRLAIAAGKPVVVIARSATWRTSLGVAPAANALRTLERTAPFGQAANGDTDFDEALGTAIDTPSLCASIVPSAARLPPCGRPRGRSLAPPGHVAVVVFLVSLGLSRDCRALDDKRRDGMPDLHATKTHENSMEANRRQRYFTRKADVEELS